MEILSQTLSTGGKGSNWTLLVPAAFRHTHIKQLLTYAVMSDRIFGQKNCLCSLAKTAATPPSNSSPTQQEGRQKPITSFPLRIWNVQQSPCMQQPRALAVAAISSSVWLCSCR
ncbi:hypothetical protein OUZ56_010438 [Daphnia magna]|uniref:Uncharacterized protein n=1 Tax=Daphnia magna TaxID=35525 RepID=A0ABR0AIL4_9CRUS|nr:hypothetical protein OUZ56_010438 [Daphnia magna]